MALFLVSLAYAVSNDNLENLPYQDTPEGYTACAADYVPETVWPEITCSDTSGGQCRMGGGGKSTCNDTDGGKVYDVKGTVYGKIHGYPYSFTDVCLKDLCKNNDVNCMRNQGEKLIEWYCKEGNCGGKFPWFEIYTCQNTCTDGKCDPAIPEFTAIGAGVAVLGALGAVLIFRKIK